MVNLGLAKKKTTGDLLYEPMDPDQVKNAKSNEAKKQAIDYERMLNDIKAQIVDIYRKNINTSEVFGKSPLTLLDVSFFHFHVDHFDAFLRKLNKL